MTYAPIPRIDLARVRAFGNDDSRFDAEQSRRERDRLPVITGRRGDDTARSLFLA